ncbi:hypothetical protein BV20DRAFT_953291 [Pilatotrama ljubarskyi]|nr:hypothetical protein BV20DRAFT_953291 [Pilatotrama ljubarskyi]
MGPQEDRRKFKTTQTVYVRAWDEIDSMPAFFAMLRGIEKRFGRVREFRLGRDFDISTKYTTFFMADFEEEESWNRVPAKGASVKVEVPVSPRDRPGGVGLDELQELLVSQDWDPEVSGDGIYSTPIKPLQEHDGAEPRKTRVVELIVQRSKSSSLEVRHRRRKKEAAYFGVAFHRWAGFYEPRLDDAVGVSKEMEQVLEKWAPFAAEQAEKFAAKRDAEEAASQQPEEHSPDSHTTGQQLAEEGAALDGAFAEDQHVKEAPQAMETSHPAAQTEAAPEPSTTAAPAPAPRVRLSHREKILLRARQHARTALPDAPSTEAEEQKKAEEEAQKREEQASISSFREKLLKLMGKWS